MDARLVVLCDPGAGDADQERLGRTSPAALLQQLERLRLCTRGRQHPTVRPCRRGQEDRRHEDRDHGKGTHVPRHIHHGDLWLHGRLAGPLLSYGVSPRTTCLRIGAHVPTRLRM